MATEAKPGDVTLIYNTKAGGHPVALTQQQHDILQLFIAGLSKDEPLVVVKGMYVEYKDIKTILTT